MLKSDAKFVIITILLITIFFSGCDNENPVFSKIKIDPELIGVWYSLDTVKYAQHKPIISVSGIQFLLNTVANFVGVETATGNLAIIGPYESLLQASDGIIALRRKISYFYNYDTLYYKISNGVLEYTSNRQGYPRFGKYLRGEIGKNILPPVNSNFILEINGVGFENAKISNNVSAYVSNYGTTFEIISIFGDGWFLGLQANKLIKVDKYTFNNSSSYNSITLRHILTDETVEWYVTDTTFVGTMEITDFNQTDRSIKGNMIAQMKFLGIYSRNKSFSKTNHFNKLTRDSVSIQISGNFVLPVY